MTLTIRFLCRALELDDAVGCQNDPQKISECIQLRKSDAEVQHRVNGLKTFLRVIAPNNSCQYFSIHSPKGVQILAAARDTLIVEFFHRNRGETVQAKLTGVSKQLFRRQRQLKDLVGELKDESSLFFAMKIISKTSKGSFSDFEDVIQVAVAVSEPLVERQGNQTLPLFYEQIDVCSHLERLRRTSVAECNLSIRAKRCHASREHLESLLRGSEVRQTRIVQLFTQVKRTKGRVMMSLEGTGGEQVWQQAGQILSKCEVDLLIVIGIGVHLLEEIPYDRPLILLTSVSVQENRLGDSSYNKDRFALIFLQHLFQGIFKRLPLQDCFKEASLQARDHLENYLWCCCLHRHAGDCDWGRLTQRIGVQQAHRLFRHTNEEWKGLKFYPISKKLQEIILQEGSGEGMVACAKDNFCCWNRQEGANKLEMHKNLNKVIMWNGREYDVGDGMLLSLKLNKFQGELCDRPLLRTRPLTIYRALQLISNNRISILRAQDISLSRRILAQTVQYLKNRDSNFLFCQLQMEGQVRIERELFGYLKNLKLKAGSRLRLLTGIMQRSEGNRGDTYQKFLQDPRLFIQNARLVYQVEITLTFVVITANPFFQGEYPTVQLNPYPHPQEKYYQILHSYRSDHLSPSNQQCQDNLENLRKQIREGAADSRHQVRQKCTYIFINCPAAYVFLGFLALFGEDGLYLTKSTRPIINQLFTPQIVASAVGRQLPVQSSVFPNCVFLQMPKQYREQLLQEKREQFQLKRLEYYNLLLRLYVNFWKKDLQSFMGSYNRKEGLFCINIEPSDDRFPSLLKVYKEVDVGQAFFNHNNFKTIYHVNQIQKIITQNMKKKRIKHFQQVKISAIPERQLIPAILLWSIAQKLSILLVTLQRQFNEKVRQLHALITVFLLKGQVKHTVIEIARIQLSLIMEQRPQKMAQGISHEQLLQLLTFFHLYSIRLSALTAAGTSPHKFKQALYNCFYLVYQLKDCCENREVRQQFHRNKLSVVIAETVWYRQLLRLIQRKTLFYFSFVRAKRVRSQEERDFRKLLNMGQIRYQFQNLYQKLPEADRRQCDLVLLEHYIKISLNETLADNSLLFALKSEISAQMQPIYQHLCLKIDKRTLFSGKRLVVVGRARNSFVGKRPYIFNRKRYLTVPYLSQLLEGTSLKSSYFNLTRTSIYHLVQASPAEVLHLLLCIDAAEDGHLLIGSESSAESISMPVGELAQQLSQLNINLLMVMGRSAVSICHQISQCLVVKGAKGAPFIIALQSSQFCMNDYQWHQYPPATPNYALKYLQNQVYLMTVDLVALSTTFKINQRLKSDKTIFTVELLTKIFQEGLRSTKRILESQFECVQGLFNTLNYQIWGSEVTIDKIYDGTFQDLTSKYYSSQHNFYHYHYYQNVGRCQEILSILTALKKPQLIQIVGEGRTGKTTILNQVTWTAQIKGFFELGISIFDANRNPDELREFLSSRKFKEKVEGADAKLMISIDNMDHSILDDHRQLIEKLANKAVTILFTADNREVGQRLKKYLSCGELVTVDMSQVQLQDVFGLLLSSIKDLNKLHSSQEKKYTQETIAKFQEQIQDIMMKLTKVQPGKKISTAIQLLKGKESTEGRHEAYYNFYKVNYDKLLHRLKQKKELQLKII